MTALRGAPPWANGQRGKGAWARGPPSGGRRAHSRAHGAGSRQCRGRRRLPPTACVRWAPGGRGRVSQTSPHKPGPPQQPSPAQLPGRCEHICQAGSYLHLSGARFAFPDGARPPPLHRRPIVHPQATSCSPPAAGRELGTRLDPQPGTPGPSASLTVQRSHVWGLEAHSLALAQRLPGPTDCGRQGGRGAVYTGPWSPGQVPGSRLQLTKLRGSPRPPCPSTGRGRCAPIGSGLVEGCVRTRSHLQVHVYTRA